MASSIACSRRAALLLVSSTCAFHSSAVMATTPEQITAIRVSWMLREYASWVAPTVTSVGTTTTARTVTSVMARPLRPNWRPSQIAGKATAMPTAVDSERRYAPSATMSRIGIQMVSRSLSRPLPMATEPSVGMTTMTEPRRK